MHSFGAFIHLVCAVKRVDAQCRVCGVNKQQTVRLSSQHPLDKWLHKNKIFACTVGCWRMYYYGYNNRCNGVPTSVTGTYTMFCQVRHLIARYALLWLALVLPAAALAQVAVQSASRFSRLDIQQGLSQNTVTALVQDHDGNIWIGTQNGLNRYDGFAGYCASKARLFGMQSDTHVAVIATDDDQTRAIAATASARAWAAEVRASSSGTPAGSCSSMTGCATR